MELLQLRKKAAELPLEPGVYLMRDKTGKIIYVGKARHLRNRVSQYFHDLSSHTPKVLKMVENVADFDVVVAKSEFDALVLENRRQGGRRVCHELLAPGALGRLCHRRIPGE